ncbi:hypothetical protein EI94DRAFT_1817265 [Lactarius quietus]|nr:hypothetical protein EI94DRAFT_1817265 [Lactarius quietus]
MASDSDDEGQKLPSKDGKTANQQGRDDSTSKGKGKGKQVAAKLQRTSSFYPGRGDHTHPLAQLENGNYDFHSPKVDDDGYVTDTYSVDDDDSVDFSMKAPSKFSESLAIERPEWAASGSSKPAKSASHGSSSSSNHTDGCATVEHGLDTAVATAGPSGVILSQSSSTVSVLNANSTWPAITKLVYPAGMNKLMLTNQRPIVRAIIQEAIDNLQAALLFNNAFPDVCFALDLIKDCLLNAANHLKPGSTEILNQLENDQQYIMKLTPLPRAHICLIRSEVKEHCNIITMASFIALGQEPNVIEYVREQLARYTYTFPGAALANAPSGLVMRSHPYRNERINNVIQDMYFTRGAASFSKKFDYLFPIFEGREGEMYEVPVPMVALVATALYVTIYEWRTGEQQIAEFSANAYLDVYHGHINTLNHIQDKCPGAFHLMMADIYHGQQNEANTGVPIAELNLNEIDG